MASPGGCSTTRASRPRLRLDHRPRRRRSDGAVGRAASSCGSAARPRGSATRPSRSSAGASARRRPAPAAWPRRCAPCRWSSTSPSAVRRHAAPDAWIVDFTNPVGIVTRALLQEGHRAVGLCNVAIGFQRLFAELARRRPGRRPPRPRRPQPPDLDPRRAARRRRAAARAARDARRRDRRRASSCRACSSTGSARCRRTTCATSTPTTRSSSELRRDGTRAAEVAADRARAARACTPTRRSSRSPRCSSSAAARTTPRRRSRWSPRCSATPAREHVVQRRATTARCRSSPTTHVIEVPCARRRLRRDRVRRRAVRRAHARARRPRRRRTSGSPSTPRCTAGATACLRRAARAPARRPVRPGRAAHRPADRRQPRPPAVGAMTRSASHVVAVDGGGSKTDVLVATVDGAVVGAAHRPRLVAARARRRRAPTEVIDEHRGRRAGRGGRHAPTTCARAHCYLTAVDLPDEVAELTGHLAARPWAARPASWRTTSSPCSARAPTPPTPRSSSCGTGINAAAVRADGERARYLALGRVSGDWGGGTGLAEAAIWAAARHADGRGPHTLLHDAVLRAVRRDASSDVSVGAARRRARPRGPRRPRARRARAAAAGDVVALGHPAPAGRRGRRHGPGRAGPARPRRPRACRSSWGAASCGPATPASTPRSPQGSPASSARAKPTVSSTSPVLGGLLLALGPTPQPRRGPRRRTALPSRQRTGRTPLRAAALAVARRVPPSSVRAALVRRGAVDVTAASPDWAEARRLASLRHDEVAR